MTSLCLTVTAYLLLLCTSHHAGGIQSNLLREVAESPSLAAQPSHELHDKSLPATVPDLSRHFPRLAADRCAAVPLRATGRDSGNPVSPEAGTCPEMCRRHVPL